MKSGKNFGRDRASLMNTMRRIAAACEGLHYVSETDAPVEPVELPTRLEPSPSDLLEFLNRDEDEPVEALDAEKFFDRLTQPKEWHRGPEKDHARRFRSLRDVLENELEDLRVYRVGEVRVDILILGRTRNGTIAGVRTRAVET